MTDKNIIVLGASGYIGKAIAARAAENPSRRILAVARSKVPDSLAAHGNVEALSGIDLCDNEKLASLARKATDFFDSSFSVIHAVGDFWEHKPLIATSLEESRSILESTALTLANAATVLTPVMYEKGGGCLVTLSCNSVRYNYPYMVVYTAAKAYVEAFTRSYAYEQAEHNISAFCIGLSTIKTDREVQAKPQSDHDNFIAPKILADYVLARVLTLPPEMSGNVLNVFRHSPSFYGRGYLQRNPVLGL